jgi:hypothetical protein
MHKGSFERKGGPFSAYSEHCLTDMVGSYLLRCTHVAVVIDRLGLDSQPVNRILPCMKASAQEIGSNVLPLHQASA